MRERKKSSAAARTYVTWTGWTDIAGYGRPWASKCREPWVRGRRGCVALKTSSALALITGFYQTAHFRDWESGWVKGKDLWCTCPKQLPLN